MPKVKRSEFASFLNTAPGSTNPTWSRMGKGITGQTIAYNPNVSTEQYIHEDSATSSVESYAPSINTPQTAFAGDAVFDFVDGIRQARGVGAACETEICLVYIYDATGTGTVQYAAEKCGCTIAIEEFGGDAGNPTSITYTVYLNGDPVLGKATITAGALTFTANT